MEERLKAAFVGALGIPLETDFSKLGYRSIPEWDSVAHMQLIGEIERVFDIMLETEDVLGMSSYAKACDIVKKYGVAG